ncbi:MAG TPA: phytanoyl-CoA dioxygenase family protein, partial [Vicinamibacterales bacterium]|nr:phytanoyl-CoA dioxygenase family protein [Vicinamibacterales bacterium]
VYRSPVSRQAARQSWLWHFDNHPREMLKVMVYLTDVNTGTAPFEFIRDRPGGRARLGTPLRPKLGDSRVPAALVDQWISEGAERVQVTGRRGTVLIFDDNVVHRGTLASTGHRDVVVFQLRPAAFKPVAPIDPAWTGSFPHHDYHFDPWLLTPRPR